MTDEVKVLSDDEVAEIEARYKRATPPPWECGPTYRFIGAKNAPVTPFGGGAICNPNDNNGARLYPTNRKNNAEFIAHAREDIPALCATVRALRVDNERITKRHNDYESNYILPCFKWAEEAGIDLQKLVRENAGRNCVELLVTTLRELLAEAQRLHADAEEDHASQLLKVGELQSQLVQLTQERDELRKEASELRDEVRMLDHT